MASRRVALYTRVSTEDQVKEGFSLDAQLRRLRLYSKAQGWTVAGTYVDEGKSARQIGRKQYKRMMDERHKWDTLLVLKIDRVHRNQANFIEMMKFLKREGKTFASVMESIETETAAGSFVVDTLARLAQLWSDTIAENVVMGMKEKFEQNPGIYQSGSVPWAYKKDRRARLHIRPDRAAKARYVYELADSGLTVSQVNTRLHHEKVLRNNACDWQWPHLMRILMNPIYCGDLVFGDHFTIKDYYPAIVPRSMFKRVNLAIVEQLAEQDPGNFHTFHERNRGRRLDRDALEKVRQKLESGALGNDGFKVPFGYRLTATHELREVAEELKVVRAVFAWYERGQDRTTIAAHLRKIKCPPHGGSKWNSQTIERVLAQQFYAGIWKYRTYRYATSLRPVIPRARFEAVQRRLRRDRASRRRRYGLTPL